MEFIDALIHDPRRRPSALRCRCCWPASPASIPSAPASSTSGSRARCWPPPSPPPPPPPSTGSAWLGLLARRARRRRRWRWSTALPRSPIAATRSSPASRSTSSPPARPSSSARPGSAQGGRTPPLAADARFDADQPALRRRAARRAGHRPDLFRPASPATTLLVYVAFLAVPFTWWVLFRTRFGLRLRAVGENPAAVDTAGISVDLAALPRRHLHRRARRPRRRLSVDRADRRLRQGHDRRARATSRSPR